ncbi:efflux RND transporter periplasmic adaptor subunit [Candidatus Venteria ishoeyi]|uniref:Multidrug resistance protein MdtA n=1 Tax=Candidatus Venteria ishoeyi TaxID=1899563 RepID=A0A1H6FEN6_9GAMM|nr:efflux RND transporter periplasmic adaptor subunit [Candidatus Venteria ishoeyi]SEH07626.1 Multidrug resistance protein MdtA precursor [Candidatus Venteria ishoeyi]
MLKLCWKVLLICCAMLDFAYAESLIAPATEQKTITATLSWGKQVDLSLPASGKLAALKVKVGDRVKAGQILLSLDQRAEKARLSAALTLFKHTKSAYAEAKREAERTQALYEQTLISTHEWQVSQNLLAKTLATQEDSKARISQAKVALDERVLNAPFAGRVAQIHIQAGQAVNNQCQSQALLTLIDDKFMSATAALTLAQWQKLQGITALQLQLADKSSYQAEVVQSGLNPQNNTPQINMHFTPQQRLLPGTQVELILPAIDSMN